MSKRKVVFDPAKLDEKLRIKQREDGKYEAEAPTKGGKTTGVVVGNSREEVIMQAAFEAGYLIGAEEAEEEARCAGAA